MKDQPNWFPKVHRMPSEWVMPDHFPDLSEYDEIAIDLETRDPGIKDKGPGYIRKDGEVVGIAIACLLYTSPSPRDRTRSRMPSSA